MMIWDGLKICPAVFPVAGAVTLALGMTGCSLLEGDAATESAPSTVAIAAVSEAPSKPLMSYKVDKGDSLWKLARDYRTTIQEIRAANQLEGDLIRAGDTILIPTDYPDGPGNSGTGETRDVMSVSPREAAPAAVRPGEGTQPILGAPTTPPSQAEPAPDGLIKQSASPITSEDLRSANIRYFSNQPASDSQ